MTSLTVTGLKDADLCDVAVKVGSSVPAVVALMSATFYRKTHGVDHHVVSRRLVRDGDQGPCRWSAIVFTVQMD